MILFIYAFELLCWKIKGLIWLFMPYDKVILNLRFSLFLFIHSSIAIL